MTVHTLYAVPFACSFAVHLVLRQRGVPHEVRWVSRGASRRVPTEGYAEINPKRKVPALVLPDGEVLTEMVAVLWHLEATVGPRREPAEGRRLLEWLSLVATELHQAALAPLYDPSVPEASHNDIRARLLEAPLTQLEAHLTGGTWLVGNEPSGADAYLAWALLLLRNLDLLPRTPAIQASRSRMRKMPWMKETMDIEREALLSRQT